jgi:hypothetical protein
MKRKNSIFAKQIPLAILWSFLDTICKFHETYYLIDKTIFLKMVLDRTEESFLDSLKPYYFKSKHSYLEKPRDYNAFVTILRQICNYHNHPYTTLKKYNHSDYTICYFIERPKDNLDFLI